MRDNQTLDAMLGTMASQKAGDVPPDFMNGVWQRAGQLGEIADQRRRMALFAGLFVVGLTAGAGTSGWPSENGAPTEIVGESLVGGESLSPAALLHVGS
ncbi:MAG: hypothetical protein HKO05_10720 [Erythrobacter sp.]|jgi:hypothetical protein|uniref:Uncharacterized protein n=2 Tax=Erythrobacteraceae TaxID=335929 RepID=A0A1Y6FLF4_9SPHN|nr:MULTISPECIES: hypothetical protein [Erythrobacteraceae]MBT8426406.1 hypothetical protein [Erythrobacter sp.]RZV31415.1 MAG: hypothetical protein EX262_08865 [Sphingomonadaceae bacterium]WBY15495.1 hypothetical protein PF049_07665 [Erythrobacteraceae bacterium WH01K]EAQ29828.1 hypothetical protein NAP1_03610 [Erythrobacter sp. NAP1]MBO9503040.1 hypothetical protein [Qipengyuania flava]|tara:strand:+ start:474 stop:770 length:297 start_codon:yes stop_codon:yes gene_type:complete